MPERENRNIAGIVKEYGNRLLAFVRGKVTSPEDAEDIVQDVWFQLSKIANLDELENASGWLYQVARNRVTDLYRKRKPAALEDYRFEGEDGEMQFKEILLLDDSQSPELALFKDEFWAALLSALDELPENQRQVFILNELEDITLQEIADKSGENLKTIISRKGYAVKHLRKRLATLYRALPL